MASSIFNLDDYLMLLDLLYQVAQALEGKTASDSRLPDCQQLATKLFFHCSSIYCLRQGTKAPVPKPKGAFFFDFVSIVILARAVIETYLTMFEVFFEPTTEDDKEFRHALWLLSGFILREKYAPSTSEFQKEFDESRVQIREMRERIKTTQVFKSLTQKQQKDILKGKRRRTWDQVVKNAGFGERTIRQIYAFQSSYVHADGLSGTQITTAKTKDEQIQFIETQMTLIMMFMSKMILNYTRTFPESDEIAKSYPISLSLAAFWSGVASRTP